ncbi:MAG TPA: hypothetical protein VFX38_05055 [Gammaproteobacteria bacterium]|nr:hypothetical protein [Gammaproteobacteria bacterium]
MIAKFGLKALLAAFLLAGNAAVIAFPASAAAAGDRSAAFGAPDALPAALRPALYGAMARNGDANFRIGKDGCAEAIKSSLRVCFDARGAHFAAAQASLALRLDAWGRGDHLRTLAAVRPEVRPDRVTYAHEAISEWWRLLPIGYEQGFTLAERPAGNGRLTLALAASDPGEMHDGTLDWHGLRYGGLVVTDADGDIVPSKLTSAGDRILITVDDAHAAYPLVVDPLVWLEQKVSSSDGAAGDNFGWSVAISGDNAVVGAKHASVHGNYWQGAVYVFSKSDGVWSETQKLTASDGVADDRLGNSVGISGPVIVVGAPDVTVHGNAFAGAAYVFTRSDDGSWTQSAKLVANDGAAQDQLGASVAVSGSTILAGAELATIDNKAGQGATYVFTGSGDSWNQVQKITADDGGPGDYFGASVAIAGSAAIVGATQEGWNGPGVAYVFENSGGTWNQTGKLTDANGVSGDVFGLGVAISGSTAVVGAPFVTVHGNPEQGAAFVFSDSGGSWTQTQELFDADGGQYRGENFGWDVALSDSTMLIGSYFAQTVFEYTESNGTWTLAQKLSPSDATADEVFGPTVALSGTDSLVGAQIDTVNGNDGQGAAYFYGAADLGLTLSASGTVGQGQNYVSQTIATNNASAASPAVSATISVPAAASFVAASASQGSCSEDSGVVSCDFGAIAGNAGTATANVTLKATGNVGDTIENTASVAKATPALSARAPTEITGSESCPDGYTSYSGTLVPGANVRIPPYSAAAGEENAILYAPEGFRLYARVDATLWGRYQRGFPATEVHRHGPAGEYRWLVRGNDGGGDYLFCLMHP